MLTFLKENRVAGQELVGWIQHEKEYVLQQVFQAFCTQYKFKTQVDNWQGYFYLLSCKSVLHWQVSIAQAPYFGLSSSETTVLGVLQVGLQAPSEP